MYRPLSIVVLRLRVIRIAVTSALLCLLLVYAGAVGPAPGLGVPPGQDELVDDYDAYVGDRVLVDGTVVDANPVTLRVEATGGEVLVLRVSGVDRNVAVGDHLAVYGVARAGGAIDAVSIGHTPAWRYVFTRVVSAVAALWVLGRGLRHWRFDRSALVFRRRTEPLGLDDVPNWGRSAEEGSDA